MTPRHVGTPRALVSASWRRSLAARVDPERAEPPVVYDRTELADVREEHALAAVLPLLRQTLLTVADEATHMMVVTDARGDVLWRDGERDVLRGAERIGLVEGTRWAEASTGTNAMGTALVMGDAVQIHSDEHLVHAYHPWTCAAAPVRDPDTGEVVGSVDVTGPARTFHPMTLALVVAAARLAEGRLAAALATGDQRFLERNLPHLARLGDEPGALLAPGGRVLAARPAGWLPARVALPATGERIAFGEQEAVLEALAGGWLLRLPRGAGCPPALGLSFLATARPVVRHLGRVVPVTARHGDVLALLALHPEGMSADALATALHGDAGKPVTVRAELHRLRAALGPEALATRPYRLRARVSADFLDVRSALAEGRVRDASFAYPGPLLPCSEAPAVREWRDVLAAALRRAVLDSGDVEALWAYGETADGAVDEEASARLLRLMAAGDARRPLLWARRAVAG